MIYFFEQDIVFKLRNRKHYILWFKELASKNEKNLGSINIIFSSDAYILELNQRFLRHNYCTDVITFDHSYLYSEAKVHGDIFISV